MSNGELILYSTEDGTSKIRLRAEDGTVWLTQQEMAELFQTTKQNISLHVRNIFTERELDEQAVVKYYLTTASDNKSYTIKLYNLDMILAIGYRVRSLRGTQFRKWATTHLREYLVKGFVMDDERLKEPGGWDYFDELLARVRDIRASEKLFYQKVRDIFATASDYDGRSETAKLFFKIVQNKMLYAVTGKTASELIAERSNPNLPNMGLQSWKGSRVRKSDVDTGKNYLFANEIEELNRIVVMYLDYAEDQAKRRQAMTMKDWADKLDSFLAFNEREILTHAGKVSAERAKSIAGEKYEAFDAKRREEERLRAIEEDTAIVDEIVASLPRGGAAK